MGSLKGAASSTDLMKMSTEAAPSQKATPPETLLAHLPRKMRVFAVQEGGVWTAHAIEFDIVGEGDTQKAAIDSMILLIRDHIQTAIDLNEIESLIPHPAPRSVMAL